MSSECIDREQSNGQTIGQGRCRYWQHGASLCLYPQLPSDLQPTDVLEWRLVTQEMEQFLTAESPASKPLETGRHATTLPIRCQLESPLAGIPFTAPFLKLHEAVLASYWHRQVKLGDLPLDSFRMLQALEWDDPTASEHLASLNPLPCLL